MVEYSRVKCGQVDPSRDMVEGNSRVEPSRVVVEGSRVK